MSSSIATLITTTAFTPTEASAISTSRMRQEYCLPAASSVPTTYARLPLVNDFVDDTLGRGIPLAVAGHGVWLLLGSEHIRGRRLCAPADLAFDVRRAGVELVENETLHVDGCLSSSQGSVEIDDLCRTLADTVLNRRAN